MGSPDVLDINAIRALHPWPDDLRDRRNYREWLWHHDLDVDVADLWTHLIDTTRLNRALGLPEMKFDERDGVLYGESKVGGLPQAWVEEPWEWVSCQWLQNVRRYSRGPFEVGRSVFHLEPIAPGKVRYYIYFGFIPRSVVGTLWLRIGMPSLERDFARVLGELAKSIHAAEATRALTLGPAQTAISEDARGRIRTVREALLEQLGEQPPGGDGDGGDGGAVGLIDRLIEYVTQGDELDLYRIQVPALARQWSVRESELLRLCLYATRAGLLNMSWDVICPHCRGVREEAPNLGTIPTLGDCAICDIDFATDKENAIEITFHVHPSIRSIPKRFFCSAEPALKQHVLVQRQVAPGAELAFTPRLPPGRYRLRLQGQTRYHILEVPDVNDDVINDDVTGVAGGGASEKVEWLASSGGDMRIGAGDALVLRNDTGEPIQFVIENAQWNDMALRPARLFNLQEFRDLFAEEYLATDVQLAVGEQTILFTDMIGSTRFYASQGDPKAFIEIKKHFAEVYDVIAGHDGAVVKTIGDAVMGSFGSALDAVKAARQIHRRFHPDREDTPIRLRISLNTGSCIAVNLNSGIDYFGTTVNLAAKLQSCAEAGDIAMSAAVVEAPGVREYLDAQGAALAVSAYRSDALDDDVPVLCWSVFARAHRPVSAGRPAAELGQR